MAKDGVSRCEVTGSECGVHDAIMLRGHVWNDATHVSQSRTIPKALGIAKPLSMAELEPFVSDRATLGPSGFVILMETE